MPYDHTLPEAARNKLLRRADWRFLLPDPSPKRALCLADGFLSDAVAASVNTCDIHCAGTYDLVVLDRLDTKCLRTAFDRLRCGGSIYIESRRSAEVIKRLLLKTGFEDPACYRPWPSISHSTCWVPVDDGPAVRHFVTNTPAVHGGKSRVARWISGISTRVAGMTSAIARKPGGTEPKAGSCERVLLLTGGPRSTNKVVRLSFSPEDASPRLAAKMSRVPESAAGLSREAELLSTIAARRGDVQGIPRVLGSHKVSDCLTVVETALSGKPLYRALRADNYSDLAFRATTWLLQLVDPADRRPRNDWWARLVEPALKDFTDAYGSVITPHSVEVTRKALAGLNVLPVACEQRDFSPWNVLLTADGELAVLDWESAELNGLPAMDLIYFLTYLTFYRDGVLNFFQRGYYSAPGFRRSYRQLVNSRLFHDCLELYASKIGVTSSELQPLRLLTWIIHSRSDYRRFSSDIGGKPNAKQLRRSLFLNLWEEEIALQP